MTNMVTAQVTGKSQITIPKQVREILKLKPKGDVVGFIINEGSNNVRLTHVELVASQDDFTDEEYKKLLGLSKIKGGKTFDNVNDLIKDLKKKR